MNPENETSFIKRLMRFAQQDPVSVTAGGKKKFVGKMLEASSFQPNSQRPGELSLWVSQLLKYLSRIFAVRSTM